MMWSMSGVALCCFAALCGAHPGHAPEPVGEWTFTPRYQLPREAVTDLGPWAELNEQARPDFEYDPAPVRFMGQMPTDRRTRLLEAEALSSDAFSAELWIVDHVNRPVAALLTAKGYGPGDDVSWGLGYADGVASLTVGPEPNRTVIEAPTRALRFQRHWRHVVGVYEAGTMTLYVNGAQVGSATSVTSSIAYPAAAQVELAAYLENEPFMELGNLVYSSAVWDRALGADAVRDRFGQYARAINDGRLFDDLFHFTAPPYLQNATTDGMTVLFETDRLTTAVLEWGESHDFSNAIGSTEPSRLHELRIEGLEPGTRYYYRVRAEDGLGRAVSAGPLTFKTAEPAGKPIAFAVIADTEGRPHVNNAVAQLIWDERPDFVVNCGDLTDAGRERHRWQWTHEYFPGMGALHARVPAYPVPGNGESDLVWYNHYHALPMGSGDEGYYTFRYGDAQFFMLDSNRRGDDFQRGGAQFDWLADELAASDATWKIVAHHHPVYTSDEDDYGDTFDGEPTTNGDPRVQRMTELYDEFGVDLVFYGHMHSYERTWPVRGGTVGHVGTRYIKVGGAGGNLEDFQPTRVDFKHKTYRGHHYTMVNIHGPVLEFIMYGLDGAIRDSFRLVKDGNGRTARVESGD